MKDKWDKFKISSDALKAHSAIILIGITAVGSGIGNISQHFDLQTAATEKETAVREVAIGFQQIMAENTPIIKTGCSNCRPQWLKDINNLKNNLEDKYHK